MTDTKQEVDCMSGIWWHRCKPVAIASIGILSSFAFGPATFAATNTSTFAVTSTIQAACQISATNLAFGTYTGAQADATSTVSVTCTNTTTYNVGLNAGTASGATVTTRQMTGPSSALLNYTLFRDAARTLNWGSTVSTDTVAGTGNGTAQVLTVYGRIVAGQFATPGTYTDTITATITY